MKYLVREITEVDSVYHVGLFSSLSEAQNYIDLFSGTVCECWKREIFTVDRFIPDFVSIDSFKEDLLG